MDKLAVTRFFQANKLANTRFLQANKSQLEKLPSKPGVYLFKDNKKKVIYIGKARNLKNRVFSYFKKGLILGNKTTQLVRQINDIDYILVGSEVEALLLEANLVKKLQPKYNVELKDGRKYPYIKITHEDFPRVLLVRKAENDKALYFGPYPDGTSVRKILSLLRHIFPYCTHKKPYQSCLFIHLGLCPAPNISISKHEYRRLIKLIVNFLKGKKTLVVRKLTKDMETASSKEDYRKAAQIKRQIVAIENITQEAKSPFEYLRNPNLINDITKERLEKLKELLKLEKVPRRIECYDISNISGSSACGSMVVAIDGQLDSRFYRRFKIQRPQKPDDVGMLEETLTRRLKHQEWELPDLVIVDGGQNQANTAIKVIHSFSLTLPVIGIAKRLEEVYLPGNPVPMSTDRIPEAKFFLQEIRNEAHRFAKAYHLLLRSKLLIR